MKTCPSCKSEKDDSEFRKTDKGLFSWCLNCCSEYDKRRYKRDGATRKRLARAKNPEKYRGYGAEWRKNNPEKAKELDLKKLGVSFSEYTALLELQSGVCAICGNPETKKSAKGTTRSLSVDHDHITGEIRGLLCSACNIAIGYMNDSVERLNSAIQYLSKARKIHERPARIDN